MSNEPKKHHYIPQSYLKGFQIDATRKNPKICVYEKENLNKSPYVVAIKKTACIKDYHTIKINNKSDRLRIEGIFSNMENIIIHNIREVINNEHINENNKITLAITILFFKSRVPQNLEMLKIFFQRTLEGIAETKFKINNMGLKGSFSDNFKLTVNNNFPLFMMFNSVFKEEIIAELYCMNFSLLKAPKGSYFVCSDSPVSYYVPDYKNGRGVGLSNPNLEIFLPLTKTYGLLCSHNKLPMIKKIKFEDVMTYNRRTIITAEKYVFGSEENLNIQKLIFDNKNKFSGIIYNDFDTKQGRFQYSAYIPVTND